MNNYSHEILRVTLHEQDIQDLMKRFPKLSRTEICDIVSRDGPMRGQVESALVRASGNKT